MTKDLDLAISVESWDTFSAIADAFPRIGDTGIRFLIASIKVDVLPFGDVEDPPGTAQPPTREDAMSVWAFAEIFTRSLPLRVPRVGTVRIPSIPGFAASKLAAWLDRSEWNETKDAADIALVLHWNAESSGVADRLYEGDGAEILIAESVDVPLAAAHLLGVDIATVIGPDRTSELLARWPGPENLLARDLVVRDGPGGPPSLARRSDLVAALTRGLRAGATPS